MYSEKKMTLLTAIVPMTTAMDIIKDLHKMGIYTANKSAARGSSNKSVRHDMEMESLTVLIERERAEEICISQITESYLNLLFQNLLFMF